MAGFLKLLANAQQFHRVAMPAIPAHALQCFNVQSSKVSFPERLSKQHSSRFVPVKVLTVHRLTLGEGAFKPLPCFTCSSVVHAHLHEGNLEDIQSSLLYNVMVVQCYGPVTKGAHVFCRPDLGEAK